MKRDQNIAIEGMSAKRLVRMDDEEQDRLFDFFEKLFRCRSLVIISTPNSQALFEKAVGEDLANLISTKLGAWAKIGK